MCGDSDGEWWLRFRTSGHRAGKRRLRTAGRAGVDSSNRELRAVSSGRRSHGARTSKGTLAQGRFSLFESVDDWLHGVLAARVC